MKSNKLKMLSLSQILVVVCVICLLFLSIRSVYAWVWSGSKWASTSVAYDDHTMAYLWQQDISNAKSRWNSITPSPFNFYRDASSNNDVKFGPIPANKTAETTRYVTNGTITRFIINFNANKSWHNGSSTPSSSKFDARHTAVHEFGHALGLGHSSACPSDIWQRASMCSGTTTGVYYKRSPEADDKSGLNAVYP